MPVDILKLLPDEWRDCPCLQISNISELLSVYADMSNTCKGYANENRSMLELVLAPADMYIGRSDEDIVNATMVELECLFPQHIGERAAEKAIQGKHHVVETSRNVYKTTKGLETYRPAQKAPIINFLLVGDFTNQMYPALIEGAVLSGTLAATEIIKSVFEASKDGAPPAEAFLPSTFEN